MMSDGTLSQDEIDALLMVSDDEEDSPASMDSSDSEMELSEIESDTLGEIGNISFGTSATTLSTLLNQKVDITTPEVSIIKKPELYDDFSDEYVSVQVNYIEGFTGQNVLVFKSTDAAIISDIMLGGDGLHPDAELSEIHLSAVQEVMNQMMGSAATSMSTIFGKKVNITPPELEYKRAEEECIVENIDEEVFVKVSFQLKVGELIDSYIMQLIPFPFAYELVEELLEGSSEEEPIEVPIEPEKESAPIPTTPAKNIEENQASQTMTKPQYIGNPIDREATIQPASFSNLNQVQLNENEQRNLDMLLDIPLKITVELGRTEQTIKDILDLTSGSIVELDKLAGEPVDILVNEKLIAKGEVVVIDENFGVRVTDIISQSARLMQLK